MQNIIPNRLFYKWLKLGMLCCKRGVIIMDISKAFDKLNHNLLLCKLKANGSNKNALTFIQTILQIDINEQKWEISLTNGKRYQQVYPKAPFLALYFSTFSSTISFFLLKLLHYATMQKTTLRILRTKTLMLWVADLGMILQ